MMDRVLVDSPLGVLGYYATEYSLAEKISGEVDYSIVSTTRAYAFLLKLGLTLTASRQNQLIRNKLDSGLGDELFEKYRAFVLNVVNILDFTNYLPIVFGAMMMEYGATIKEDHMRYLRDLVPKIKCSEGTVPILADHGFRGPGKRQFLAALDNYRAGEPRSFHQPSCHGCGKVNSDIKAEGKTLLKCGGCKNKIAAAWFCDKVRMLAHSHLTLLVSDIVTVLSGLPESLVETSQVRLRCSSRPRACYLSIIRQEQLRLHRLRGCQCVRMLQDRGTDICVSRLVDQDGLIMSCIAPGPRFILLIEENVRIAARAVQRSAGRDIMLSRTTDVCSAVLM